MQIFGLSVKNVKHQLTNAKLLQGKLFLNKIRLGEWYERDGESMMFVPSPRYSKEKILKVLEGLSYCIPSLNIRRKPVTIDDLVNDLMRINDTCIEVQSDYEEPINIEDIKNENIGVVPWQNIYKMSDKELFELSYQKNDRGSSTESADRAIEYRRKRSGNYEFRNIENRTTSERTYYEYHGKWDN